MMAIAPRLISRFLYIIAAGGFYNRRGGEACFGL